MSKHEEVERLIENWKKEYGVEDYRIDFKGWTDLKADDPNKLRLGQCNFYRNPLRCRIYLGIRFEDRPLGWMEKSTVWHEFCHAEAFLEDGINDDHNRHWRDLTWRKPWFVIGDWVAKSLYALL